MIFEEIMNDTIYILKSDGEKYGPFKGTVTPNQIFPSKVNIIIEAGDRIIRPLSNGGEETYTVINPVFYEDFADIEAHYQLDVRKDGTILRHPPSHVTNNISFQGDGNKININSLDNSTNIEYNESINALVNELLEEISKLDDNSANKADLTGVIETIRGSALSDKPNKTLIKALLGSLPHIDSILSIGATLMSLLNRF